MSPRPPYGPSRWFQVGYLNMSCGPASTRAASAARTGTWFGRFLGVWRCSSWPRRSWLGPSSLFPCRCARSTPCTLPHWSSSGVTARRSVWRATTSDCSARLAASASKSTRSEPVVASADHFAHVGKIRGSFRGCGFPGRHAIDDAVPLTNGANAAGPRQLSDEGLALLLGRLGELVDTLTDEPPEDASACLRAVSSGRAPPAGSGRSPSRPT